MPGSPTGYYSKVSKAARIYSAISMKDQGPTPLAILDISDTYGVFPNEHGSTGRGQLLYAWHHSLALLSKKPKFKLDLRVPVSPDYVLVVSVYSNIVFAHYAHYPDEADEAANTTRRELEVNRLPL